MSAMKKSRSGLPPSFLAALLIGWILLCLAGLGFARVKGIPMWAALPALAAFLVEYPFYLVPAFPQVRERVAGTRLPPFLVFATAAPYLMYCIAAAGFNAHEFHWMALGQLIAVALALALWYFVLPRSALSDLAFGVFVGWILLGRYFDGIYPEPYPKVQLSIIGKVGVLQAAVLALMVVRQTPETGYGFWPSWREWRIGALHFAGFAAIALPLGLAMKAVSFSPAKPLWVIAGTFLGILWVTALVEEFLFRGVLQTFLERWTGNRAAALLAASVLFGLVHLPFRGFPNWRWVLLAGILGWFCGHARNMGGNIRPAMVTHALAVTALKSFF
jgi:membrane protease YdiL (CAAX protease family)